MSAPAAQQYNNKLETQFARLPDWLQVQLSPQFQVVDDLLHQVAGDPADLLRAGQVYAALGPQIEQVGKELADEATALGPDWQADSYQAFEAKIKDIEQQIAALGKTTAQTEQILQAAADAAMQGANAIIDIVMALIAFIISTLIVSIALAAVTFGASLANEIATALEATAAALEGIGGVLLRVAQVLRKVAQLLGKIANILTKIQKILEKISKTLKEYKAIASDRGMPMGARGAAFAKKKLLGAAAGAVIKGTVNQLLPGDPMPPGMVGTVTNLMDDLGSEHAAVEKDIQQAEANK